MAERTCPACGTPLPGIDPRRRWCSSRCRKWVSKVGGRLGAAELKEAWASSWESISRSDLGDEAYRDRCQETAEQLRSEAQALRASIGASQ